MYKKCVKRLIDFIVSLILIPIVLFIIVIIAPIIWLDDRGPIFYNSFRRGKDGKSFRMLKFRSMYVDSPDLRNSDGSTFNSSNDLRVTNFGRFLRKSSLDEIPQIFNVLLGHMSYVGPRPTLAIRPFEEVKPMARKRFDVRPGITGYAQAYYRNSISQDEKFKIDCEYVDNISFLLDVKIIAKTITTVIKKDNVYVPSSEKSEKKSWTK